MNTYLLRKMNRELRRMRFRAIGSAVLIFFAVAMYIGLAAMIPSASQSLDALVEEERLSDLIVRVEFSDIDRLDTLNGLPGVQDAEARLNVASRILFGSEQSAATLIGIDAGLPPGINTLSISEGSFFSDDPLTVIVERGYADRTGISVGDTVTLFGQGGEEQFTVIGLVSSPEFIFLPTNPQSIFPVPGSLGVVYLPIQSLQSLIGYGEGTVNEFLFLFEPDNDPTAQIDAVLLNDTILFNMPQDQIYGYALVREDLSQGGEFIGVIAALILMVAFFVIYSSFVRMVQEQRREIGVLRAIGYRRGQVLWSYVYISLLIGGTASAIGLVLGAPLGLALSDMYTGMMFNSNASTFILSPADMLIGILFGPLTAISASLLAVWRVVRMEPHEALKAAPSEIRHRPKTGNRSKGRNYLLLYAWRKLTRQKGRTAIMVMAVAFSVVMGAMSFLMMASLENSVTDVVDREGWDLVVDYSYPLGAEEAAGIVPDSVVQVVQVGRTNMAWATVERSGEAVIIAMDQGQGLHRFFIHEGSEAISTDEAMISTGFAEKNAVSIGEELTIDGGLGNVTVVITATVDDMLGDVYIGDALLDELFGAELFTGSYVKVAPGTTEQVRSGYLDSPLVADAQKKEGISSGLLDMMGSYNEIILIFGMVSVTISAIAIANIVYVSVLERRNEYGQLRALGYQRSQVGRSIYLEVVILVVAGSLLAIPLLELVMEGLVGTFQEFFPIYRTVLHLSDWNGYLLIVAMTFAMAMLAAYPAIRVVGRTDIAKSVTGGRFG